MFTKSNTISQNHFIFVLSTYVIYSNRCVYYTLHNSTLVDKYEWIPPWCLYEKRGMTWTIIVCPSLSMTDMYMVIQIVEWLGYWGIEELRYFFLIRVCRTAHRSEFRQGGSWSLPTGGRPPDWVGSVSWSRIVLPTESDLWAAPRSSSGDRRQATA